MKLLVVVQARMSSSRLPQKIAMDLGGKPLLVRMIERLNGCKTNFELVVATTTEEIDDPVVDLCRQAQTPCFRGHPTDLLDRHVQAGRLFEADAIAKIPSDCPLIDPAVVDEVLSVFVDNYPKYDFVSNLHPPSWPDGYDVEVMKMSCLETAWAEAKQLHEREHTTPFIWDQPGRFNTTNVIWNRDLNMSHRLTIDYQADYELISTVFNALHKENEAPFSLQDILDYLDQNPKVFAINQEYSGVNWYRHHLNELRTIDANSTRWTQDELSQQG